MRRIARGNRRGRSRRRRRRWRRKRRTIMRRRRMWWKSRKTGRRSTMRTGKRRRTLFSIHFSPVYCGWARDRELIGAQNACQYKHDNVVMCQLSPAPLQSAVFIESQLI